MRKSEAGPVARLPGSAVFAWMHYAMRAYGILSHELSERLRRFCSLRYGKRIHRESRETRDFPPCED